MRPQFTTADVTRATGLIGVLGRNGRVLAKLHLPRNATHTGCGLPLVPSAELPEISEANVCRLCLEFWNHNGVEVDVPDAIGRARLLGFGQ